MVSSSLLAEKVAVISGAGPGLGTKIAHLFAREGAAVVLAARNAERLAELERELTEAGGRALSVPTDVTDDGQCQALCQAALERFGRIDIVVNNAVQTLPRGPVETADLQAWHDLFEVTFWATLRVSQAAIPHLKAAGGGSIVNVLSHIVFRPETGLAYGMSAYACAKAAQEMANKVLAVELASAKIRVNAIVPGWMDGHTVRQGLATAAAQSGGDVDAMIGEITKAIPLGFMPTDDDCANSALFLASDLSNVVTGQALCVNGGEVLH